MGRPTTIWPRCAARGRGRGRGRVGAGQVNPAAASSAVKLTRKTSSACAGLRPSSVRSDSQNDHTLIACRPSSNCWRCGSASSLSSQGEDPGHLGLRVGQRQRLVTPELPGERLMKAGGPPAGTHLLQDPGPLADEQCDPHGPRLVRVDPLDQRSQDLVIAAGRLDQQGLHVGELLPDGPQRDAGPLGDARRGRANVTLGVQGAHRIHDRPPRAVRTGGTTIRRLAFDGRRLAFDGWWPGAAGPLGGTFRSRHDIHPVLGLQPAELSARPVMVSQDTRRRPTRFCSPWGRPSRRPGRRLRGPPF